MNTKNVLFLLVWLVAAETVFRQDIQHYYPNKFVSRDDNRFRIFNTLYELPTQYMLACLVDFFYNHPDYTRLKNGVKSGDLTMTFQSIYQDVDCSVDYVHAKSGPLKEETVRNVSKYVLKDDKLPVLLNRMRSHGAKVFLLTNSDYKYSDAIMSYILNDADEARDWTSYFDYIIVDARKPLFFTEGTILRQVDKTNGHLKIGTHTGDIKTGQIYSGGSVRVLTEFIGASINEVLYIGDHILGDILKTKKKTGWRTFLIVPEINQELMVWTHKKTLFSKLEEFDCRIGELYKNLDSSSETKPDISQIQNSIREITHEMDMSYGMLGSLFRSGSQQTFFAGQVVRYADLYAASFINLMNYPFSYVFRAPPMLMAHEATVGHEDNVAVENVSVSRSRSITDPLSPTSERRHHFKRSESLVPNLFADTPTTLTMVQEDELCDNENTYSSCDKEMEDEEEA